MWEFSRFDMFMWNAILASGFVTVVIGFPAALIFGIVWICQHLRFQ